MCLLRSWVQLPPGPFLSARELRYYFELIFGGCRTKFLMHLINERVNLMLLCDKLIIRKRVPTQV